MDHLGPTRQPFEVPFVVLDKHRYDNLGFEGFPDRMGYDPSDLFEGKMPEGWTRDDLLSFWQSWLFFGSVIEVMKTAGIAVTLDDFVRTTPEGRPALTTERLPFFLRQLGVRAWDERRSIELNLRYLHGKEAGAILQRGAQEVLTLGAWGWGSEDVNKLVGNPTVYSVPMDMSLRVFLSISCLGEALSSVLKGAYAGNHDAYWPPCLALKQSLRVVGWCPYEINRMFSFLGVCNAGAYYLSYVNPRRAHKDHRSCAQFQCDADQIDDLTYQTKHTTTDCDCRPAVKDEYIAAVHRFATKGCISIYTVQLDQAGDVKIRVKKVQTRKFWRRRTLYVAISHVWSDGLGNPNRSSLPRCQLLRIQELCNNLYPKRRRPIPFWIDTLCVPHDAELKRIILRKMAGIYEGADKVLVLDSTMLHISVRNGLHEPLMHFICSSWCQRMWTLQEGFYARNLCYQFLDGTIMHSDIDKLRAREEVRLLQGDLERMKSSGTFDEAFESMARRWMNAAKNCDETSWVEDAEMGTDLIFAIASRNLMTLNGGIRGRWTLSEIEPSSVIIASLPWRQTSKSQDEVICLASLLGLGEKLDLFHSAENPMKEVILACNEISASVLFGDRVRSQEPGFRWMPTSFLGTSPYKARVSDSIAWAEADGLYIVTETVVFNVPPDVLRHAYRKKVYLQVEDDPTVWQFSFLQDSDLFGEWSQRNIGSPAPDWSRFVSKRMAFVLEDKRALDASGMTPVALVSITDEHDLTSEFEGTGILAVAHDVGRRTDSPTFHGKYIDGPRCLIIR